MTVRLRSHCTSFSAMIYLPLYLILMICEIRVTIHVQPKTNIFHLQLGPRMCHEINLFRKLYRKIYQMSSLSSSSSLQICSTRHTCTIRSGLVFIRIVAITIKHHLVPFLLTHLWKWSSASFLGSGSLAFFIFLLHALVNFFNTYFLSLQLT